MRRKKKILSLIALLLIAVGVTSEVNTVTASAETPYKTYTVDGYGRTEETQAAYIAKSTVIGFGNQSMKNPTICLLQRTELCMWQIQEMPAS